jgi:CRISPR associated protein Cas1
VLPRLATLAVKKIPLGIDVSHPYEGRMGAADLGLDPGIGVLHKERPNRDSLACDLMEPVRPLVDAYLFDWLKCGPLRREWFFEQGDGNC